MRCDAGVCTDTSLITDCETSSCRHCRTSRVMTLILTVDKLLQEGLKDVTEVSWIHLEIQPVLCSLIRVAHDEFRILK